MNFLLRRENVGHFTKSSCLWGSMQYNKNLILNNILIGGPIPNKEMGNLSGTNINGKVGTLFRDGGSINLLHRRWINTSYTAWQEGNLHDCSLQWSVKIANRYCEAAKRCHYRTEERRGKRHIESSFLIRSRCETHLRGWELRLRPSCSLKA